MPDDVRLTFVFQVGQCVRWDNAPERWLIVNRRYYEGTVSRYVTYGMVRLDCAQRETASAYEVDLTPVEETP